MINFARDQKFHWFEPFAFARARAASAVSAQGSDKLILMVALAILLPVPLLAAGLPDTPGQIGFFAASALGGAAFFAYIFIPLATHLPNDVLVTSDRIVIGRECVPFSEIVYAIVGTTVLNGQTFPVLTFRTSEGQEYLYGLGRKVELKKLAEFLDRAGVREPRA